MNLSGVLTSVSTPLFSDLSKSRSTTILNSTLAAVRFSATSSLLISTSVARSATTSFIINSTSAARSATTSFTINSTSVVNFPTSSSMSTVSKSAGSALSTEKVSSTSLLHSDSSSGPPPSDSVRTSLPSPTNSTSSQTTLKATDTTIQHTSESGSTIFSVTVVHTTAPGETSTITTHPASTLSKPVVSTTTDANGSTIITTPPLVTIWSTSTESNGSLVTTTSIVANAQQDNATSEPGFLHNPGAVAGIFSVVGVVFAIFVVCMAFCIRRRIHQREKLLSGMNPQRPSSFDDDPFHDDYILPAMRSVVTNAEDVHWDQKGLLTPGSSSYDQQNEAIAPVLYPIFHDGTFNQQSVGIESSTEPNRADFRRSKALSTPSIYSVSVVPEEDVAPGQDEQVSNDKIVPNLSRSATASSLPPRPPRSHLRDRTKSLGFRLPTAESSYHTSPISESRSHDVHALDRKTILDVQSRLLTS